MTARLRMTGASIAFVALDLALAALNVCLWIALGHWWSLAAAVLILACTAGVAYYGRSTYRLREEIAAYRRTWRLP